MSKLVPHRSVLLLLAAAGLGLAALAGAAEAATLNVANNGVDSATCGAAASPCRSISQAIANANAGDRIVVGPGRYGDLDGDGLFNRSTGEEWAISCCMISVDKPLTIESRAGAGATVLDAGGAGVTVVRILASGVVFGKAKKGFTLTGGSDGLFIDGAPRGVRVAGNLAIRNNTNGIMFNGSGHTLIGNVASANGLNGFNFVGDGHVLTGNLASGNILGGFFFTGLGHQLTANQSSASSNGSGFFLSGTGHRLTGNVATANAGSGFDFSGGDHVLIGNAAHGNLSGGIFSLPDARATISQNNVYGNNGCGLMTLSGSAVTATNNFWGAGSGPGGDPADGVCIVGSTTVVPFATREFRVKGRPLF